MTYTEIKKRNDKRYYYRVKSIRKGKRIEKQRIYLGANLTKEQVAQLEKQANEKLLNIQKPKEIPKKETTTEKDTKGITSEKDEFSEWFTQIMIKAELADYTKVSGCMVFRPAAWKMWEKIMHLVDERLEKLEVKNIYFPLLIPEKLLKKEQAHVKGFSPEVAWVTHAGNSKLNEKLAIRPTSEAIIYDSFPKWIRSYKDLPLKLNQWSNVVRWEFKHPIPFFRTREFIFNEGHTAYATKKQAEAEKKQIIGMYKDICKNFMALPALIGRKTDKEKFAGAEYTISMEFYMPNGKGVQGPDFHHDGQNFAKAYDIQFLDENEKKQYVWQNTWAISTRMLGVMFAIHSDSQGLIIPPKMAPNQIVIIPILFEDSKKKVIKKAEEIKDKLMKFNPILDKREDYSPGFKFNEYELRGIPIRIEIGPKELKDNSIVLVRRDKKEKQKIKITKLDQELPKILEDIQDNLFKKAKKLLYDNLVEANNLKDLEKEIKNKKLILVPLCKSRKCEDLLKHKTNGAKVLNIPEKQPKQLGKCVICNKKADYKAHVGRSY